jgi:hypothetical protein
MAVGSGAVESACRQKQRRFKRRGQFRPKKQGQCSDAPGRRALGFGPGNAAFIKRAARKIILNLLPASGVLSGDR